MAAEQPDLIFTYTLGTPEGLDALLTEIRRHTTADIIVPSIHFNPPQHADAQRRRERLRPAGTKIREICRKHGAEFVENRREMAEYLQRTGLTPDDLLCDHVHQNLHGLDARVGQRRPAHRPARSASATRPSRASGGSPWPRPRRPPPSRSASPAAGPRPAGADHRGHGRRPADRSASPATASTCSGRTTPGGGTREAVHRRACRPSRRRSSTPPTSSPSSRDGRRGQSGQPGDDAPHAVTLGKNVVPQTWTITMTSDTGDYRLARQRHRPRRRGKCRPAVAEQIGPDRHRPEALAQRAGGKGWPAGLVREPHRRHVHLRRLSLRPRRAEFPLPSGRRRWRKPLVENLPNRRHTLEIVTAGDGVVTIEGLYVFQPPEKD